MLTEFINLSSLGFHYFLWCPFLQSPLCGLWVCSVLKYKFFSHTHSHLLLVACCLYHRFISVTLNVTKLSPLPSSPLFSSPLFSSPLFSSPLSGDELQFNCWTLVSVAGGCHGKIKSFSWGVRKGESGDGGPLSCSSAGCISPTLYNCVKGALPVAPSLLTGMVSPWQPDTPCPLALSLSLPVSLISGCPSAPSPPFPPLGNLPYCYFDPVPPPAHIAFSFHRICLTSSFVRAGPIVQGLLWLMSPILRN